MIVRQTIHIEHMIVRRRMDIGHMIVRQTMDIGHMIVRQTMVVQKRGVRFYASASSLTARLLGDGKKWVGSLVVLQRSHRTDVVR
jgi:hypothetical protein